MNRMRTSSEPVRLAVIGAGNRANKYLEYARLHPERLRPVAVAEPNGTRRRAVAEAFGIPDKACFVRYEQLFGAGIDADAVLVASPDDVHRDPVLRAIRTGHHVLIEKPVAQQLGECLEIERAASRHGVLAGVCYVLRYHPYFCKIREIVASGELGRVVSIDHIVSVGLDRAMHSYVRGIFRRTQDANAMLLAKCCHDIDFLLWILGSRCRRLSSFGSLGWFRPENAPAGSAERCIDCRQEAQCPYSARDLYLVRRDWISNFDVPEGSTLDEAIMNELRSGPHGRCVFRCDNDVVDRQVLALEMADGATVSLTMDMLTADDLRRTRIRLTGGEIEGDEQRLTVRPFRGEVREYDFTDLFGQPYHAGADLRLIEDFIEAVHSSAHPFRAPIGEAVESHRICFAAEESRLTGRTIDLDAQR